MSNTTLVINSIQIKHTSRNFAVFLLMILLIKDIMGNQSVQ